MWPCVSNVHDGVLLPTPELETLAVTREASAWRAQFGHVWQPQPGCHSTIICSKHSSSYPRRYSRYGHLSFSICVPVGGHVHFVFAKSQVVLELTDQAPFEMCDPFLTLHDIVATQHRTIWPACPSEYNVLSSKRMSQDWPSMAGQVCFLQTS